MTASEKIESHTQTIAGLIQQADDYATRDPQIPPLKNEFNALYLSYVMDHQREIHERSMTSAGKKGPSSANHGCHKKIELLQGRTGVLCQPAIFSLNEDLTIYHALEQKHILLDALQQLTILSWTSLNVGEIDTAGLQLLILLKKEAQKPVNVSIIAHSQAVRSAIELLQSGGRTG